jgi:tetratricopeptide (TPR) repeat protein
VAAALGVGFALHFFLDPSSEMVGPSLSEAPAAPPAATPPTPLTPGDAAVPETSHPAEVPASLASLSLSQLQEGFCAADDAKALRTHHSLRNRLAEEANRRRGIRGAFDPEETGLLRRALAEPPPDWAEVLRRAETLSSERSDSPWPPAVLALAAHATGDPARELEALRSARARLPHDAALGLALALLARDQPDVDEAIEGLKDFLAVEPAATAARLLARLEVQRDVQRSYARRTLGGVTLVFPPETVSSAQAEEALNAVARALDDAATLLGVPRPRTLTAVVYPSRSELLAVSCAPTWAEGMYDGTLRLVAGRGGVVRTGDVRHEALHAVMTPLALDAPTWFHEGLAQYFAGDEARARSKWRLMVRDRVWIPFASLDGSFSPMSGADAELAYSQSLGLVELVRETCGPRSLAALLAAFRARATTTDEALSQACSGRPPNGEALLEFLQRRLASK